MARADFESRTWGGLAIRGAVAIVFGILALSRPGIAVTGLVYLFGAYVFIDGIAALATSFDVAQLHGRWGGMFLVGLTGIAIGVLSFTNPSATAVGLIYSVAVWAVLTGIFEIAAAVRLRKVIEGEWMMAVAGVLSIAFGVLIATRPGAGMMSVVMVLGAYAIIFGALMIALAIRLRGRQQRLVTA